MKKLALTSLLAVFAISGAHAANVLDGNPLYMPKAGHFYSVSSLGSHTENADMWVMGEEFGYGVADNFSIILSTAMWEDHSFDYLGWGDMDLKAMFRVLDAGAWKADLYGSYGVGPVWGDHAPFLDHHDTWYTWTAGVRGGYMGWGWTVAGHVAYEYDNAESFNWGDGGLVNHALLVGLDGQLVLDQNWNLVAGVEYKGYTDKEAKNAGHWNGMLGVNYNFDATKYLGAYVTTGMNHWKENGEKGWDVEDGFGFGMKFGIDF